MDNHFVLGIDFGTSTTLVALPGEPPTVIPIGVSFPWIPSIISSNNGSTWSVGDDAEFSDVRDQIRSPKTAITFDNYGALTNERGIEITPEDAILIILKQVKQKCRENGLSTLGLVRMSCPAIWTGEHRRRLTKIAISAGFNVDVDHIMDEPIAAAISWWWNKQSRGIPLVDSCKAVIFDLGGGTLDVAVVDIYSANGKPDITVMSARGTREAGDELDSLLAKHVESELLQRYNFDLLDNPAAGEIRGWILRECRGVKERLSVVHETIFEIEQSSLGVPSLTIGRQELEEIFRPQLEKLVACTEDAIREAKMKHPLADLNVIMREEIQDIGKEVNFVVLAGGMSQIPIITTALQKIMPDAHIETAPSKEKIISAIVEGVSNLGDFANLNVHRPSFDFLINWKTNDGIEHEKLIFPAFTSLYDSYEIAIGTGNPGKSVYFKPPTDPIGMCHLIIRSVGGKDVSFNIDGKESKSIPLNANRNLGIKLKLCMNGRLFITDSLGFEIKSRIHEWPIVRWGTTGRKPQVLVLEKLANESYKMSTPHWDLNLD